MGYCHVLELCLSHGFEACSLVKVKDLSSCPGTRDCRLNVLRRRFENKCPWKCFKVFNCLLSVFVYFSKIILTLKIFHRIHMLLPILNIPDFSCWIKALPFETRKLIYSGTYLMDDGDVCPVNSRAKIQNSFDFWIQNDNFMIVKVWKK